MSNQHDLRQLSGHHTLWAPCSLSCAHLSLSIAICSANSVPRDQQYKETGAISLVLGTVFPASPILEGYSPPSPVNGFLMLPPLELASFSE